MNQKKKLVRITVRLLPNETFFRFCTENLVYYRKFNPAVLEIEVFLPEYESALNDLDVALDRIRKSAETDRIAQLDDEFDKTYVGMAEYTRSFLKHIDPALKTAAENICVVFDKYGNIGRKPYRQELGASHNIMQELDARQNDVNILNLAPWMRAHRSAADALAALLDKRTGETAAQTDIRVADARKRLESVYQKITDRIDAVFNLRGTDCAGAFFAEYNAHATEYKNTLAQHLGRKNSKAGAEE